MSRLAESNHASTGVNPVVRELKRERPATDRQGLTHKVTLYQSAEAHGTGEALGDAENQPVDFYITLNRFPDGRPCEVFAKATHGYQGWCDAICRLVSLLLQHGVAPETICSQLRYAHFAPFGQVPGSGFARSFPDYLARWLMEREMGVVEPQIQPSREATADKLDTDEHGFGG